MRGSYFPQAGFLGNTVEASGGTVNATTNNVDVTLCSVQLKAGKKYLVFGGARANKNGSTAAGGIVVNIRLYTAEDGSGGVGQVTEFSYQTNAAGYNDDLHLHPAVIAPASDTTYYLRGRSTTAADLRFTFSNIVAVELNIG